MRVLIAGGGTGGHVFPAIAIAEALRAQRPEAELLFVGAQGRMEMERVPAAGYRIEGLPMVGVPRRKTPVALWRFLRQWHRCNRLALELVRKFRPDVVVGVGGYASVPACQAAMKCHIPVVLQEQNGYAGKANRLLSKRAAYVCVAYPHMDRYFPANKLAITGNPVRSTFLSPLPDQQEARRHFGLPSEAKVIFVVGGSLGAQSLCRATLEAFPALVASHNVAVMLQTGKTNYQDTNLKARALPHSDRLVVREFIVDMPMAYAAADIIVSRAGAIAISELALVGKPVILVPSPNVADDHQTKNAKALAETDAVLWLPDAQVKDQLTALIEMLLEHPDRSTALGQALKAYAKPEAARHIADKVLAAANSKNS